MKAFILAGGQGLRLRPYTNHTPKPMLPIGDEQKPILYYVIENLKKAGVTEVIMALGYKAEKIQEYFKDGSEFGIKIDYSVEKERKNTAGSILGLKNMVDDTFVVVMGDHITNIDLKDMIENHKKSSCIATMALYKGIIQVEYGVVDVKDGLVQGFQEKPKIEKMFNMGIYVFEPKIFDYVQPKEDFAKDVFPRLLKENQKINTYVFDKIWYDVGRKDDYEDLNEKLKMREIYK